MTAAFGRKKVIEFFILAGMVLMESKRGFGFKYSTEIPFKRVFVDEDTSLSTCRSYSFLTTKSRAYAQKAINKNIKCGLGQRPRTMDDFQAHRKVINDAKTAAHSFDGINNPTETFELIGFNKNKSIQHYLSNHAALLPTRIPKHD